MKVLFIGNSYTFYGDVPGQVGQLASADAGSPSIETDQVVRGGANLRAHVLETGALKRVGEGEWTHVVLQENSTGALHDTYDFRRSVLQLGLRATGQVLLFETWARQSGHEIYRWGWSGKRPNTMLRRVRKELAWAAGELNAEIVPVGTAWQRCLERYPRMVLHDADQHHASALGSHLAACVFFAWLTGRDPRPVGFSVEGVDEEDARRLRSVAWDALAWGVR